MYTFLLAQADNFSICFQNCIKSGSTPGECNKGCAGSGTGINNPALGTLNLNTGLGFFQKLIPSLIGFAFVGGVIIFFFILLTGAIQWMTSGGDKGNLEAARGRITSALIGIVVLFSTFAIIKLIENFFKIDILTLDIGPLTIK